MTSNSSTTKNAGARFGFALDFPPAKRRWLGCMLAVGLLLAVPTGTSAAKETLPGGRRPFRPELNGRWIGSGVCFSPYRPGQAPDGAAPTDDQVLEDLRLVSRYWQLIRLYDFSSVAEATVRLIARQHLPMRVMVGAWIAPEKDAAGRAANRAQVDGAIRLAKEYPGVVIAVCVGNEAMVDWSDHRCDPALVIGYVREVRRAVAQPVTVADDFNFWNKEASIPVAAVVDFVTMHAYALWNGKQLDEAMAWTGSMYEDIRRRHPGVPVIIGENGWATRCDPTRNQPGQEGALMKGAVSVAAQAEFLRQQYHWVQQHKVVTLLFEAFDEAWKGGGAATGPDVVEKHWGVFDGQRQPKPSFAAFVREFYPKEMPPGR